MPSNQKFPNSFRRIRLELAREPGHPVGEPTFGYTLVAPLDKSGKLDPAEWRLHRDMCRVVRFRPNGEEEIGHLIHTADGNWKFQYDIEGDDEEETGYRLGKEQFLPGEYVSIKSDEGMHTYKVISVVPV